MGAGMGWEVGGWEKGEVGGEGVERGVVWDEAYGAERKVQERMEGMK